MYKSNLLAKCISAKHMSPINLHVCTSFTQIVFQMQKATSRDKNAANKDPSLDNIYIA